MPHPCNGRPPGATNILWEGRSELPDEDPESLFKRWLAEHGGAILKVARADTFTAEDGQDLVQEILLQVWRSLPQFQGRAAASIPEQVPVTVMTTQQRQVPRQVAVTRCVIVPVTRPAPPAPTTIPAPPRRVRTKGLSRKAGSGASGGCEPPRSPLTGAWPIGLNVISGEGPGTLAASDRARPGVAAILLALFVLAAPTPPNAPRSPPPPSTDGTSSAPRVTPRPASPPVPRPPSRPRACEIRQIEPTERPVRPSSRVE